jgi:hypothetical protein
MREIMPEPIDQATQLLRLFFLIKFVFLFRKDTCGDILFIQQNFVSVIKYLVYLAFTSKG